MTPTPTQKVVTRAQDLLAEVSQRLPGRADKAERARQRWLAVTVERDPTDLTGPGHLPAPLAELGDRIEVAIRPGPGQWGTEIAARPVATESPAADRRARAQLRVALRKSRQLVEVGEVLVGEPRSHGHRPATPAGKLVDLAENHADEAGLL